MKRSSPTILFLLAGAWLCLTVPRTFCAPARPNVVFILADDLGIVDINAYAARYTGAKPAQMFYETPHLDRLITQGTAFSQAYACQLCAPTRASLLTGKNAAPVGVTTAVGGTVRTYYNQGLTPPPGYLAQDALEWSDKEINIPQALLNGTTLDALPAGQPQDQGRDEVTIAEALTDHHSAFIGKWHLGGHGSRGWQPKDQGFEELSYFDEGGSPYFNWRQRWDARKLVHPNMPQPELLQGRTGGNLGQEYLTDELTEHAVRFLKQRANVSVANPKPFFLYFCHFAVHTPFQARSNDIVHFERKATRGWNGHSNAVYAAMLKGLDDSVGRLLQTLADTGLETNTIVVFMSDNGGVTYTDPIATWNAPFTGGKAMHFEGGIRVPLLFRWPGRVPENQWCNVPVDCSDLFPTILDLAGYDVQPFYTREKIDGRSLAPLFHDPANHARGYPRDKFYWHYPLNVIVKNPDDGQPLAPHSAIRDGDLKLIFDWSGALKLYNMASDPYEKTNLSDVMPDQAQRLFCQLNDWLDANVAVKYTPALNPAYDPAKEVRARPFVDLREKKLGETRAIRPAESDLRLRQLIAGEQTVMMFGDTSRLGRPFSKDPSVIRFSDRYLMYFSLPPFAKELATTNSPRGWSIAIAESRDLIHWKKFGSFGRPKSAIRTGCAPPARWFLRVKSTCSIKPTGAVRRTRSAMRYRTTVWSSVVIPPIPCSDPPASGTADVRLTPKLSLLATDYCSISQRAIQLPPPKCSGWLPRRLGRTSPGAHSGRSRKLRSSNPSCPGKNAASKRLPCSAATTPSTCSMPAATTTIPSKSG